jgi:3'-phosphoadenosine 5'-phosphosulfate sulfotransferase (PAPS reductase)/FAD synthetase
MVPICEPYVKDVCSQFGWNLKILRPKVDFWTLVGEEGYPMPTMRRRWCCFKLKLEPIRDFMRTLNPQRAEVTGLRRDESIRRRGLPEVFYLKKSYVWKYAPIASWNEKQVLRYMQKHDLPMPPHYRLGIKETCLCGAFSNQKQMMIVRANFPDFFQKFVELEKRFKKKGAAFYFHNKPCTAKSFLFQKTIDEMLNGTE